LLSEIIVPFDHRYTVLLSELSDSPGDFHIFNVVKYGSRTKKMEEGEGRGEISCLETASNVNLVKYLGMYI